MRIPVSVVSSLTGFLTPLSSQYANCAAAGLAEAHSGQFLRKATDGDPPAFFRAWPRIAQKDRFHTNSLEMHVKNNNCIAEESRKIQGGIDGRVR
jgi:hypothetical protein